MSQVVAEFKQVDSWFFENLAHMVAWEQMR